MKKNATIAVIFLSIILSLIIQTYTVLVYLEQKGYWPPTLFVSGIVLLISWALNVFFLVMATRMEKQNHIKLWLFWVICASVPVPWIVHSISVFLDAFWYK